MPSRATIRTLVYKRTHTGDPDSSGRFGIHGCMGRVRAWEFDAVVGVGGIGAEPTSYGIDGLVTWIGIGTHRSRAKDRRGPLVTFDHFVLFDQSGPPLHELAPHLARRMYEHGVRTLLNPSPLETREISRLLRLAANAPPSSSRGSVLSRVTAACACGKRHSRACPNHPLRSRPVSPEASCSTIHSHSARLRSNCRCT
jgi:hypothetical protein